MTIRLDPLIPTMALLAGLLCYLAAVGFFYRRHIAIVSRRYWAFLLAAKILSALGLVVLLLNPYFVRQMPDTTTFNVAMLVDGTASMDTRDCAGASRLETVKEQLLGPDARFRKEVLESRDNINSYLFAGDELRRFDTSIDFESLPGDSDIDVALRKLISNNADSNTVGAVLLVSDGLDNRGFSLIEGSKPYEALGIPIHCIGVGDNRQKNDLGITWTSVPDTAEKSKAFQLKALVQRNFEGDYTARVEVHDGVRLVHEQKVEFTGTVTEMPVEIQHTAFVAGFEPLKIRVLALPEEVNKLNNIDFAGTDVTNPYVFEAFYYSANLDWDYKYLKFFMEGEERMRLSAVIRVGEESYYARGINRDAKGEKSEPEAETALEEESAREEPGETGAEDVAPASPPLLPMRIDGFPDHTIINSHSCLIVDLNSLYLMDEEDLEVLVKFVENRGGGIIFTGIAKEVPQPIRQLLPVRTIPDELISIEKARVAFRHSSVLARRSLDNLEEVADRLSMPPDSFFYKLTGDHLKPGALTVATVGGSPYVIVAAHNYGAGKVAFVNLDDTWKWVMNHDDGDRHFAVFWGQLISWISSSSKQRITVKPTTTRLDLANEQEFSVEVLDVDYIPDNHAEVLATITTPDGDEETMRLFPNPKIDGRYIGKFIPRTIGEYRFRFEAKLKNGDKLRDSSDYLVVNLSPEAEPRPIAETRLQSLARLTGGQYWNYHDIDEIDDLPINRKVSFIEEKQAWLKYWAYLAVLIAAVLPDWILRRRIGLR
jgi:hypothetical protein